MLRQLLYQSIRSISTTRPTNFKVTVLGAAGGIGQPLTLLLKLDPLISELVLYDIKHAPGVTADVSHIDTYSEVRGHLGVDNLPKALRCANIVVIPAGVPRKPGMTRDDLFTFNAEVVKEMACSIAEHCPKALVAVVTNPVNSVVPLAAEIFKEQGMLDPKRLFGVSTLDVVRSSTFVGGIMGLDPKKISVPVICGHSGVTIIPLISQCKPTFKGDQDVIEKLTKRIQEAGTEVVNAKAGAGSATLAMAYAGARFVKSLLRGLKGEKNVVECSFVISDVCDTGYFSTPLKLGKGGLEKNLGIPSMNDYETELLEKAVPELKKNIQRGVDFVKGSKK